MKVTKSLDTRQGTREVTKTREISETKIVLTMTEEEAQNLAHFIGGTNSSDRDGMKCFYKIDQRQIGCVYTSLVNPIGKGNYDRWSERNRK